MESLFDQNLISRVLMSIVAFALCFGPPTADFNATHATNPLWPGHARFHVVWQVVTNSSLALVMMYLLWVPLIAYDQQLKFVGLLMAIVLGSFYVTLAVRGMFGGTLKDPNGIKPIRFKLPGRTVVIDSNLFGFSVLSMVLVIALCNLQTLAVS